MSFFMNEILLCYMYISRMTTHFRFYYRSGGLFVLYIYIYTKPDDGPFGSKRVVSCEQKLFDDQFVFEFGGVLIQRILVMSHRCQ